MKTEYKFIEHLYKFCKEIAKNGKVFSTKPLYYEWIDNNIEYSFIKNLHNDKEVYSILIALPIKDHPEMHVPIMRLDFTEDGEIGFKGADEFQKDLNNDIKAIRTPNGTIIAEWNQE